LPAAPSSNRHLFVLEFAYCTVSSFPLYLLTSPQTTRTSSLARQAEAKRQWWKNFLRIVRRYDNLQPRYALSDSPRLPEIHKFSLLPCDWIDDHVVHCGAYKMKDRHRRTAQLPFYFLQKERFRNVVVFLIKKTNYNLGL
jgi:hypothetical protein